MRALALALLLAACGAVAPPADLRPIDIGPPPTAPAWPEIEPRPYGEDVCMTPEDALAIHGWRADMASGWARLTAWGGYWRGLAQGAGRDAAQGGDNGR